MGAPPQKFKSGLYVSCDHCGELVRLGDDHTCDEGKLLERAAMLLLRARGQNPENSPKWYHYDHALDTVSHLARMVQEQ